MLNYIKPIMLKLDTLVKLIWVEASRRYPLFNSQFYSNMFKTLFSLNYYSRVWSLNSLSKPHTFVSLPLQSNNSNVYFKIFLFIIILLKNILYYAYYSGSFYLVILIFNGCFICFWVGVVLLNVYKSMLNLEINDLLARPFKISLYTFNFTLIGVFGTLFLLLISFMYITQLYKILSVFYSDGSIIYKFLVVLAVGASFRYLVSVTKQLSKPGKKDFSLASCYMRKSFTLNKFILFVCFFLYKSDLFYRVIWFKSITKQPVCLNSTYNDLNVFVNTLLFCLIFNKLNKTLLDDFFDTVNTNSMVYYVSLYMEVSLI